VKEYGNAIELEHPDDVAPADVVDAAQNLLDFNYRATKAKNPEWGLPEKYQFIRGPIRVAMEVDDCPQCQGKGHWSRMEWECEPCNGTGIIEVGPKDPPRWVHTFAWYVLLET